MNACVEILARTCIIADSSALRYLSKLEWYTYLLHCVVEGVNYGESLVRGGNDLFTQPLDTQLEPFPGQVTNLKPVYRSNPYCRGRSAPR